MKVTTLDEYILPFCALAFLVLIIKFSSFLCLFILSVHCNLLVILLKSSKILTGLRELSLFHTLTDIPVNKGTLGVHKIELVVDAGKSLSNGSVVGNHTASTLGLGDISIWNLAWWLGVDTSLESSRTPVNELDGALILDCGHGGLDIGWGNISTVHETARHELSVGWVTLGQQGGWLGHDSGGQLSNSERLVVCLLTAHERSVG
mmetsp:Transcript_1217/g.1468  ORF Transcript_1217/g.1468 Transcript_1217/m.1468 type:complete len:205 (-) Transcript_1217:602-1216(-)